MFEEEKDVNVESSTTNGQEEVVNKQENVTDQQSQETQGEQQTSEPEDVNKQGESLVKDNRPIENVIWEAKRKVDDLTSNFNALQQRLEQQLSQTQSNQQQNQTTDEQLLWCIEDPNATPEAKFYARNELRRRDETKQEKKLKEVFNSYQQEQGIRQQKISSFNWFASNFPDAVIKDNNGNPFNININHPLVQKMDEYMRDPQVSQRGDALIIAAKNAAFDLGYTTNKKMINKINQTTAQLKKEQKKTLIAGSGTNIQDSSTSQITKVAEEYRKTNDPKAFKRLLKSRGLIPQG